MAPDLNDMFLFYGVVAGDVQNEQDRTEWADLTDLAKLREEDPDLYRKIEHLGDGTAFYEDMDIPIFQANNMGKNCQDAELFNHPGQFVHWSQGVVDEPDDCENIRFVIIYRVLLGNVYEGERCSTIQ